MAREGTRSATGNSKPRVFDNPDTAPAIARKPRAKTTTKPAGSKPVGVTKTKKTGPVKKACCSSPALKNPSDVGAKAAVKKVEAKVKKATTKKPKTKTAAK
ncbi:hypothetical protein N0V93_003195 [Gnomoniopsis smithogilvyi]|uniref:Uncharacterized protein n=1 Tax=Gnomoniopsis smithogilvyi TaxID=1191159 RepID=A0A9W8YYV6_9PEZI|nr:hypothetical protein N0V93_003195 [Gnomoniopsis smithogilvyi]